MIRSKVVGYVVNPAYTYIYIYMYSNQSCNPVLLDTPIKRLYYSCRYFSYDVIVCYAMASASFTYYAMDTKDLPSNHHVLRTFLPVVFKLELI